MVAIAQYYEVVTGPRMKVIEAIQLIGDHLNLPDPEKEAAARLGQEEENRKVEMEKIGLEREKLRIKLKEEEQKTKQARLALQRDKVQHTILQPASGNRFDPSSCL